MIEILVVLVVILGLSLNITGEYPGLDGCYIFTPPLAHDLMYRDWCPIVG